MEILFNRKDAIILNFISIMKAKNCGNNYFAIDQKIIHREHTLSGLVAVVDATFVQFVSTQSTVNTPCLE